jgi:peptidyl-prolyl cis-trans isomerase SurA
MKFLSFLICLFFFFITQFQLRAQVIFSFNATQVSRDEFLQAFSKNNTIEKPTEKDFREYLELYIRYKLKVKAAYDKKLDTLPNQVAELADFKSQIAGAYLTDEASFNHLLREVFERSQKDIHLSHIYIPIHPGAGRQNDTAKAWRLAMDAYNELKRGTEFGNVASIYSGDSAVRFNKGDIGFITVFTLPYDLENLAWQTPPGKFSLPYRGRSGYHIFMNMGERKAAGKIKVAQVLIAMPPNAGDDVKKSVKNRADSVYRLLQQGEPFAKMALNFSNDNSSYINNGELPEIGVGTMDPVLENAAFALEKPGDFTMPVLTSNGYHIILLKEKIPVSMDSSDEKTMELLKQRLLNDPRIEISRKAMERTIEKATGLKRATVNEKVLMAFADSAFQGKKLPGFSEKTVLVTFPRKQVTASDLAKYLQAKNNASVQDRNKSTRQLVQQFMSAASLDYYREHLEEYNPAYASQVNEFREGNLLFEIMQRNIWDKASEDSAGLKKYFEQHKDKYMWEPSAAAVIFSTADSAAAVKFREGILKNPGEWNKNLPAFGETIMADSGRFEISQLTMPGQDRLSEGMITPLVKTEADERISFIYITRMYPGKAPRNFNEAKGFVLNDYQAHLEENWINELKKKYPVQVREEVFNSLLQR